MASNFFNFKNYKITENYELKVPTSPRSDYRNSIRSQHIVKSVGISPISTNHLMHMGESGNPKVNFGDSNDGDKNDDTYK